MARLTRDEIIADARKRLREPDDGRFFTNDPDVYLWLRLALHDIAIDLEFEKKKITVLGNTHIAALGTAPRYYEPPTDFFMIDPNEGVMINGLRRIGTTEKEIDSFQSKAISNSDLESSTATITVDDYFDMQYSGLIFHYGNTKTIKSITDSTGAVIYDLTTKSGELFWFVPSPEDADLITLTYFCIPAALATGAATGSLNEILNEIYVYALVNRMAEPMYTVGRLSRAQLDYFKSMYGEWVAKGKKIISKRMGDRRPRIKTGKHVYNSYNSRGYGSTGGLSSE